MWGGREPCCRQFSGSYASLRVLRNSLFQSIYVAKRNALVVSSISGLHESYSKEPTSICHDQAYLHSLYIIQNVFLCSEGLINLAFLSLLLFRECVCVCVDALIDDGAAVLTDFVHDLWS